MADETVPDKFIEPCGTQIMEMRLWFSVGSSVGVSPASRCSTFRMKLASYCRSEMTSVGIHERANTLGSAESCWHLSLTFTFIEDLIMSIGDCSGIEVHHH